MNVLIAIVFTLAGFAAGVVFSNVVRVFIDREVAALRAEGFALRQDVAELEQKIASKL